MIQEIIAQVFGAGAVTFMFLGYLKTTKKKYLFMQILCNIFFALQFGFLGATSAVGVCVITIFKSLGYYIYAKDDKDIPIPLLLAVELVTIVWGFVVVTDVQSAMPIVISCVYTYATWQKNLKLTYVTGTTVSVLWVVYYIIVGAYISIIGSGAEFVASVIGITKLIRLGKASKDTPMVSEAETKESE